MMSYACACGWGGDRPSWSDTSRPAIDRGFDVFGTADNTHIPVCPECGRDHLQTVFKEST
jgi:hypothetical protein